MATVCRNMRDLCAKPLKLQLGSFRQNMVTFVSQQQGFARWPRFTMKRNSPPQAALAHARSIIRPLPTTRPSTRFPPERNMATRAWLSRCEAEDGGMWPLRACTRAPAQIQTTRSVMTARPPEPQKRTPSAITHDISPGLDAAAGLGAYVLNQSLAGSPQREPARGLGTVAHARLRAFKRRIEPPPA